MASGNVDMAQVGALCHEVAEGHGLLLYDVELLTERGRTVLRVFVDRPGGSEPGQGATVDDCESVARELGQMLDVSEELIPIAYALEVSSPGVERPLKREDHYRWAEGQLVQLVLGENVEGQNTYRGVLAGFAEGVVQLRVQPPPKNWKKGQRRSVSPVDSWQMVEIPLGVIRRAQMVYDPDYGVPDQES